MQKFVGAFKPNRNWGPLDPELKRQYDLFMEDQNNNMFKKNGVWNKIKNNLFG